VTWNPLRHALNNEGATHDAWGLWSAILAVLLLSFNVSTVAASRGDNSEVAKDAGVRTVTHQIKELRHQFLARMSDRKHAPQIVVAYQSQLNFYRRVREHVLNIAEAIGGEK